ncbi:hypothetical protein HYE76_10520 [Pseudomonas tolaasii]|uniref:hypothetical protein n=1 Tax=Pseudomonas tolaasii TaxID=29442 RepID=UPI0015A23855|nr:hypothetical protein [Pseudomonas tolaasii]NWC26899.1 hypothetical protein [Pseudomonas tolaasii]
MKQAKRQPFTIEAALTLALGVSSAFAHVAAAPIPVESVIESRKQGGLNEMPVAEKAALRANIKRAMSQLSDLSSFLRNSCMYIMADKEIPRDALEGEPFTKIASTLRELESAMKGRWELFSDMPIIGSEFLALRKSLAVTRSRASQNSILIQQKLNPAVVVKTSTDISGLGRLADISTERLLKLVS